MVSCSVVPPAATRTGAASGVAVAGTGTDIGGIPALPPGGGWLYS
jgi:hypothetical protein